MPDPAPTEALVLTTHPGLEDLLVEELAGRLGRSVSPKRAEPGRVALQLPASDRSAVLALRTVHHVLVGVDRIALSHPVTLEAIQAAMADVEIPGLRDATSFRVRSVRRGQHDFNHMAIERAAGGVLWEASQVPVNLKAPELTVRVDLEDDVLWVGILLTDKPMSRRAKVYAQRVGLSADLAYAAVHAAELSQPRRVLDPFCGSGTLLLEAGACFEQCELWGSDWVPSAVEGARRNLNAAGFEGRSQVVEQDALHMSEVYPAGAFDAVVSNPPFGVKMGPRINFYRFYQRLLGQLDHVLAPHGRAALWVHRTHQLRSAVGNDGRFAITRTLRVQAGTARPTLVALRRL